MTSQLLRYRHYALLASVSLFFLGLHLGGPALGELLRPAVLLICALALSGTRLRVERLGGSLATSDVVLVGALTALSPIEALLLGASAAGLRYRLETRRTRRRMQYLARWLAGAAGAFWAASVFHAVNSGVGADWVATAAAGLLYLFAMGLAESLVEKARYWRQLVLQLARSAAAMAIFFSPAAVLVALFFTPDRGNWFWAALPLAAVCYGLVDWFLGPLHEDLGRRRETDGIFLSAVEALALAVDAKDSVSSGHLKRVQRYCVEIAKALNCSEREIRTLEFGALLHDIGKIAVPENVLTKPGRLSPQEFSRVASHVQIGAEILSAAKFPLPVAELVLSHHENWDGTGYPYKLQGEEIPIAARILAVVDTFDALTSDRPYRPAMTVEKAVEHIKARRGKAFDPRVTDALIELLPRLEAEIQNDPQASRRLSGRKFSIKSPREVDAEQTSLTHEERIESFKQIREVARREADSHDFSAWYRLLSTLGLSLPPQELLEFVFTPLAAQLPFDECAVFTAENNMLTPIYCSGRKADLLRNLRVPVDSSPTGWVAGHGESLVNGNPIGEHSELGLMAWLLGLKAALVVPLWERGQVVGTFNLYSKTAGAYSREHARLAEKLTQNLGGILRTALLFETGYTDSKDSLTGLPTARETLKHLRAEVELARQENRSSSVIYIDIEDFHAINARFGLQKGDELLQALAETTRSTLRKLDYFGRLGQDQFLAVLGGIRPRDLEALTGRLKTDLAAALTHVCSDVVYIGVSLGSATFPDDARSAEELVIVSHHRLRMHKMTLGTFTLGKSGGGAAPGVAKKIAASNEPS